MQEIDKLSEAIDELDMMLLEGASDEHQLIATCLTMTEIALRALEMLPAFLSAIRDSENEQEATVAADKSKEALSVLRAKFSMTSLSMAEQLKKLVKE